MNLAGSINFYPLLVFSLLAKKVFAKTLHAPTGDFYYGETVEKKSEGSNAPPPLGHEKMDKLRDRIELISRISSDVLEQLGEEKALKGNFKYKVALQSRVESLLEELPSKYLESWKAFVWELVPLLRDFYLAGTSHAFNKSRLVMRRIVKKRDKEWMALTQYFIDEEKDLRKSIGEKYPQGVIDKIVREQSETNASLTKICKRVAADRKWDEENLRQAVYRRYPLSKNKRRRETK